jgi:uncharacterized protein involved in exopolysaccharide biosynthesis
MARIEEATLFRPGQVQMPGRGGPAGPMGGGGGGGPSRGGGGDDDDGPQIAVRERIAEAGRSAKRRKGLSFVVVMICGALTVLGAIFAPRSYEVESRVLVQRTTAITGQPANQFISPEEQRNTAREYEEQVMARDNILAIVKSKNLVARWDDMRQPHRRLIDKINRKLGKGAPSDDEKFEALVANIEHRMKVFVDATTVTVKIEWSEPTAGKDIVEAAVKNFLDARYQSEVGVIPARLKIQESFVTQAHKDLEVAAQQLVQLQRANDPKKKIDLFIPTLPPTVKDAGDTPPDPALQARLDGVRAQINAMQGAKAQRLAELNQQLVEKQQQLGPQHPDIIGLKSQIAALNQEEPPQLASLRAQERQIQDEINQKRAAARVAPPAPAPGPRFATAKDAGAPAPEPLPASAPKNVQDAQVQFDSASGKYQELVKNLQAIQLEMQTAEAAYKNRYKVTHPAEVPAGPKRPVGLIAVLIGFLATIAAVLMVAALADRFSGIFFEPREVRDRLGLPVFATFS